MFVFIVIAVIAAVIAVLCIRAYNLKPLDHKYKKLKTEIKPNPERVYTKLKRAIRCRTVSHSNPSEIDFTEFVRFRKLLNEMFPLVHETMSLEIINDYSLLFKWSGSEDKLKPGLFMAHIDVVPIEEGTEKDWVCPPFGGEIKEGYLWGRGSMDIKIQLITMLESCELLIEKSFKPRRTLYFAFGHDEEIDGSNGAAKIAEKMKNDNIELEFVNDEGCCINSDMMSSINKPIAFIGVAEKGFLNLEVKVIGKGGHSSTPPEHSTLGLVAKAICRLEKKKMKIRATDITDEFLKRLGRHMSFGGRLVVANFWFFRPIFMKLFTTPGTTGEALMRTTIAATMAHGSMEPNVLPQVSSFILNCRILQGDTYNDVIKHVKKACRGMDCEINILRREEPSPISPSDSEFFNQIAGAARGLDSKIAIVPYLMVSGTDSIKYRELCSNLVRFSPYRINSNDLKRIHGTNERISLENILDCTKFYLALFSGQ